MTVRIITGDVREVVPTLPAESFDCIVTSPPYFGLRDYGVAGQIGLEPTLPEYLDAMVFVCRELRRVLKPQGTFWLNIGDSYAGSWGAQSREHAPNVSAISANQVKAAGIRLSGTGSLGRTPGLKPKDLMMVPTRLALALQADDWWVRSEIIWAKPNPMPESVTDRPTSAHEKIWLLTKSERYFFDADAVRESAVYGRCDWQSNAFERLRECDHRDVRKSKSAGRHDLANDPSVGRNIRNVWSIATQPFKEWTETFELVPVPASEGQELCAAGNASGDGIARITSPDCPSHEGQSDRVPKGFCDGLPDPLLRSMFGNENRRARGKPSGSGSIRQSSAHFQALPSMPDCQDPPCSETAIPHSIGIHKTDPAPLSCGRAILCEETASSTGHTEPVRPALASTGHGTDESKSEADSSASSSEPRTQNGSARRSKSESNGASCCCSYYRKVGKKTSHFATFPPKLAERCIKAGCPIGGHVLDPFGGAGTTGLVADRLQRHATLIELNPDYAAMARRRIDGDAPLFAPALADLHALRQEAGDA